MSLATIAGLLCADFAPPRVTINLDTPPDHRWDGVAAAYNSSLWAALAGLEAMSPAYKLGLELAPRLFSKQPGSIPDEHWAEMTGIARVSRVPIGVLVALNTLYDLTASANVHDKACTSVVAQGADGKPTHGRNLDYGPHAVMKNITAIVDYQSGGKTKFSSVSFLGCVNFNTVVVPGGWSLSQDERDQGQIEMDWFDAFVRRRVVTFSQIRLLAETEPTFEGAVNVMRSAKLDAPSYFILAGTQSGEGAVVSSGRDKVAQVRRLQPDNGTWYVLETNYDGWVDPDHGDDRRDAAERHLAAEKAAGDISADSLWRVLTNSHCKKSAGERPVLNSHTVFTATMDPSVGFVKVQVHDPSPPAKCLPEVEVEDEEG